MEQHYRLQALYIEKTPFPYACQSMATDGPCCSVDSGGERALTDAETESVRGLILNADGAAPLPPGLPLPAAGFHMHDHCQITYCAEGSFVYVVGRTPILCAPGDILVINELIPHGWITAERSTLRRHVGFYPHTLNANAYSQRFLSYFGLIYNQHNPFIHIRPDFPGYGDVARLLEQIDAINLARPFAFDAAIHNLLFSFSLQLFYAQNASPSVSLRAGDEIERILRYIEQNLDGDLSLQALAREASMNPSYFSFYFKKHLGVSYKKYVTTRKVAKAADMLRYSEQSVTQILFECGFSSVSAFYSAFSGVYAVSPAEFRKIQPVNMFGGVDGADGRQPR